MGERIIRRGMEMAEGIGAGTVCGSCRTERERRFGYVAEVDALRAFAVTAVVLFHCGLLSWGWAGVWLFFVISGFAITTSLLNSEARGPSRTMLIRNFYIRRTLRIWPLYFGYVALASALLAAAGHFAPLADLPWVAVFAENIWHMVRPLPDDGFWLGFVILWSLAVEEQFYLVFPVLFAWLPRRALPKVLLGAVCLAPVIRYAVGAAAHDAGWSGEDAGRAIYAFMPAHVDSFALGALIALYRPELAGNLRAARLAAGLALVLGLGYAGVYMVLTERSGQGAVQAAAELFLINSYGEAREMWVYSVLIAVSAALLLLILGGERWFLRLMRLPLLQTIGRISFGAYIFHGVALWFFSALLVAAFNAGGGLSEVQRGVLFLAGYGAALVLAHVSYRYYEKPFVAAGQRFA